MQVTKEKIVPVRMTIEDLKLYRDIARRKGLTLSALVRNLLEKHSEAEHAIPKGTTHS